MRVTVYVDIGVNGILSPQVTLVKERDATNLTVLESALVEDPMADLESLMEVPVEPNTCDARAPNIVSEAATASVCTPGRGIPDFVCDDILATYLAWENRPRVSNLVND